MTGGFIFSTSNNGTFGTTSVLLPSARLVVKSSSNTISNNVVSFFNSDNTPLGEFTAAGGLSVGQNNHLAFAGQDGTISAKTGYQVANQATEGNYLRGDGTNFVDSAIQAEDLPSPLSGSGAPSVSPRRNGDTYFDYTNSKWYKAFDNENGDGTGDGLDADDWLILN